MAERISLPVELKDKFPGVEPERVRTLMQNPAFKTKRTLSEINQKLNRMITAGEKSEVQDLINIRGLFDSAYYTTIHALDGQLMRGGFRVSEIDAAQMVADKVVKLP